MEAVGRLADPQPILSGTMLTVAVLGLLVNVAAFWVLSREESDNLNMRAAVLHVAGDLLGSVAAIVAALVIMAHGLAADRPDPCRCSSRIIILRAAWHVVRQSGHILLEGAPAGIDTEDVREAVLARCPSSTTRTTSTPGRSRQERPMVTLHACVDPGMGVGEAIAAIKARLAERFSLDHCTVEIEHGVCADETHERIAA